MRLIDKDIYESFFDYVDMTSEIIEEQISRYNLIFSPIKNPIVEWKIKFPIFLDSFYRYIYTEKRLPNQNEFWEKYLKYNRKFFKQYNFDEKIMVGLKARIFRAYPSLVRDIHFICFVKEKIQGDVIYNRKLDTYDGIDMLIDYKNKLFGVSLFTNTPRSVSTRKKKNEIHLKYENVTYIDLPVDLKNNNLCGDFYLYGENEYDKLISELDSAVLQDTYELGRQS